MKNSNPYLVSEIFSQVTDPRRTTKGNFRHKLGDIILLVLSSVLCGCNDWDEIELFGNEQKKWLKKMGDFSDGIPSHDTINRVFRRIGADEFSLCFSRWTALLMEKHQEKLEQAKKEISADASKKEIVAIDGKRIRNSHTEKNQAIHMVSALAVKSGLCLGQRPTDKKKNEITTIPLLLDLLSIKGCIVTIDAMGCQKKIAQAIRAKEADYVLAVKDNHKNLKKSIEKFIPLWAAEKEHKIDSYGTYEKNRGRIEKRTCFVCNNIYWLSGFSQWKDLKCFAWVETERQIKKDGQWCVQREKRYYISSLKLDAKAIYQAVRSHWAVENNLHWHLDVTFKEDLSRKRKGNAAINYNVILKTAMTLLMMDDKNTLSLKRKRQKAIMNKQYRRKLLKL